MAPRWFLVASLLLAMPSLAQAADESQTMPVVTVTPACPEVESKPGPSKLPVTHTSHNPCQLSPGQAGGRSSKLPVIHIRYNPSAPVALLRSSRSLTLHIANVVLPSQATVHDLSMTRQPDGTWIADFDPPTPFGWGYFVFYFEDNQHHPDRNHGAYWDIAMCFRGEPFPEAAIQKSNSWMGELIAPGIQRPLDIGKAIAVLKDDFARYPNHVTDFYMLWTDELTMGDKSPASYEKVGREVDEYVAKYGNNSYPLMAVMGFVAANQAELPPGTVERFRQATIALPQTAEPTEAWRISPGKIARSKAWIKGMERNRDNILAELDFWPIWSETNLRQQTTDFLAYIHTYPNSTRNGEAYSRAMYDQMSLNDMAGIENVYNQWSSWDPKNPDPPAILAHYYLDHKLKLERAVELLNQAQTLFRAAVPENADKSSRRMFANGIKSNSFGEVAPFPDARGKIEFLRGQVYSLLNRLPEARADLEAAVKAMPDNPDVQFAVGQIREKMGDTAQALDAYLAAASALYGSTQEARDSYVRLFVALKLGSEKAADKRLFARVKQTERQLATQYIPVLLNQPAPEFSFQILNGKLFDNKAATGTPAVIDFWSVWCAPCTLELPALLKFQRLHPKVNVLAVAIDKKPQEVQQYLEGHKLSDLRVAVLPEIPTKLATAYPTTIILDRSGRIQFIHDGFLPGTLASLDKDLDALHTLN